MDTQKEITQVKKDFSLFFRLFDVMGKLEAARFNKNESVRGKDYETGIRYRDEEEALTETFNALSVEICEAGKKYMEPEPSLDVEAKIDRPSIKPDFRYNMEQRDGWLNRHTDPLPKTEVVMVIVSRDVSGEEELLCHWYPFNKDNYRDWVLPGEGYVGTARVISDIWKGIGFNVWQQNDSEFVYYKLVP